MDKFVLSELYCRSAIDEHSSNNNQTPDPSNTYLNQVCNDGLFQDVLSLFPCCC